MTKKVRFGVVVFPGSNCDHDCYYVIKNILNQDVVYLWHKETNIQDIDVLILPGGFSYGDYLRSGAMAACSPIMNTVKEFAKNGGLVLGICNGFQILLEVGLLPGAMKQNNSLKFICKEVQLKVLNNKTPFTNCYELGEIITIPIAHKEGNYCYGRQDSSFNSNHIVFSYEDNPNGSYLDIAGLINQQGNVLGMMPHPERASEEFLLNNNGLKLFESIVFYIRNNKSFS